MKRLADRLAKLETTSAEAEQRITRIELVDGVTGEVFAVIEPTSHPMNGDDIVEVIKARHRAKDAGISPVLRVQH